MARNPLQRNRRHHARRLAIALLASAFLALAAPVMAGETGSGSQAHFRTGMISGSYSGAISGNFGVANSLDMDWEFFKNSHRSILVRGTLCDDLSTNRMVYSYIGIGGRFYFKSTGMPFDASSGGDQVVSTPKMRYYAGIDGGISQVIVKVVSPVLVATSSMLDFNVNVGAIYQLSKTMGLEGQFGYGMGFGFSTVSVGGSTTRMLVGASFSF